MKNCWGRSLLFVAILGGVNLAFLHRSQVNFLFVACSTLISLIIWFLFLMLTDFIKDRSRGFSISTGGEYGSELKYTEYGVGTIMLFVEAAQGGYVTVPSESEWQSDMPDWAKDRRAEIMNRIVNEYSWDKSMHFENYNG